MSDSLGLSIGTTNLVAVRTGRSPVTRRSVLTLFEHRPPEVGLPSENPGLTEHGMVMWGFVERVGDPVPLVAQDGSSHRGDVLATEALDAIAQAAGPRDGTEQVTIAVPAYWGPAAVGALRAALRTKPSLYSDGAPPELISDAATALAALQTDPGLPTAGVVALCDFGGSGTTIALADASAGLQPLGELVRYPEFSGDQIDQTILNHVLAGVSDAGKADPAGTAAVGSLTRLRSECRQAKERLSAETATVIPVELPGTNGDVRLTRTELENLIDPALAGFLDALGDVLERSRIPAANLAAIATVGGGAAVPLITQRLSEALRIPVVTMPDPGLIAAAGAAVLAERGPSPDAATGLAQAADMPTGLAPAAWAAGTAGAAAAESATDGSPSATFRALAWSQDDSPAGEPVPYAGEDYTFDTYGQQGATSARPAVEFERDTDEEYPAEPPPLPWYKRPPLLFGAAAAAALLAVGGLAVTLTGTSSDSGPVTETSTLPGEPGQPTTTVPQTSETVTVTGSNGEVTTSLVPPPPPPETTTTTNPTTTTTSPTTTTTTTTTPTTTRTTTTTAPTTTQPTTTTPPTTTQKPPTTTVAPPETSVIITGATRPPDSGGQ